MLGNVVLLCFFVFFVFAIVGLQLWAGLLRNRCVPDPEQFPNLSIFNFPVPYYVPDYPDEGDYVCSSPETNGLHSCHDLPPSLSSDGIPCNGTIENQLYLNDGDCINWNQYYNACETTDDNLFGGALSFDNIPRALITIFVAISLDGWADIMYHVQEVYSVWVWVYFVLLIVIGSFYMVNLFLAVIAIQFAETKTNEEHKMKAEKTIREKLFEQLAHIKRWNRILQHYSSQEKARKKVLKQWLVQGKTKWEMIKKFHSVVEQQYDKPTEPTRDLQLDSSEISETVDLFELFNDIFESFWAIIRDEEVSNDNEKECVNRLALQGLKFGSLPGILHLDDDDDDVVIEPVNLIHDSEEKPPHPQNSQELVLLLQKCLMNFVGNSVFRTLVLVAIVLNTLSMAIEHHQQPHQLTQILEISNCFFTGFFTLEMMFKILALGPKLYIMDSFNIFDGTVVILSLIELFSAADSGLSVLRAFRLLRVLKLIRFIPSLRYQLMVMIRCLKNVRVFFILFFLFTFIFTLLGMVLFGAKFCHKDDHSMCSCHDFLKSVCHCRRDNFDTFFDALLTVFVILTGSYADLLFDAMNNLSPWTAVYFIVLVVFGNYIMLNLAICILLEGFEETDESKVNEKFKPENKNLNSTSAFNYNLCSHKNTATGDGMGSQKWEKPKADTHSSRVYFISDERRTVHPGPFSSWIEDSDTIELEDVGVQQLESDGEKLSNVERPWREYFCDNTLAWKCALKGQFQQSPLDDRYRIQQSTPNQWNLNKKAWKNQMRCAKAMPKPDPYCPVHGSPEAAVWPYPGYLAGYEHCVPDECYVDPVERSCFGANASYPLFIFSPKNPLTKVCQHLINQKCFDYIVLVFIILNCLCFTIDRPTIHSDIQAWEAQFLTITNYIFTAVFTIEMLIKVIAKGLIFGKSAYFKNAWNILDGTLVIVSCISLSIELWARHMDETQKPPAIFGVIRVLRLLRALRPLRVVNRAPGLKLVVETVISSLKPIGSVLLISSLFFVIFAILGVQLFKGKMSHCHGPEIKNVTNRRECEADGRNQWLRSKYNFDDLFQSLLTLTVLSTLDNWSEIVYDGMDTVGADMQPVRNFNKWHVLYFVLFILFVGFFVLNMFVGVVVENFQHNSDSLDVENVKERQKKLSTVQISNTETMEDESIRCSKKFFYNIVTNKYFDLMIATIIVLNVVTMSLEHYLMPVELVFALKVSNWIFTSFFTLEAMLKVVAMGTKYFNDKYGKQWSIFVHANGMHYANLLLIPLLVSGSSIIS